MSQMHRPDRTPPLLVVVNARVCTNDPARPWADALLLRDGLVAAVGSSAELRKRAGPEATIVDARSWLVLPTTPEGSLRAGAPATLVIVERAPGADPQGAEGESVVFALERGHIGLDRHGLAR